MEQVIDSAVARGLLPTIFSDSYSILQSGCTCPHCHQGTPVELVLVKAPYLLDGRLHTPSSLQSFKQAHPELFDSHSDALDAMFSPHLMDTAKGLYSFYFKGKSLIAFEIKVYDPAFPKKLTSVFCQVCGSLLDVEQLMSNTNLLYNIHHITDVPTPVGLTAEYIYDINFKPTT